MSEPRIIQYLKAMAEQKASDLYLTVDSAPKLRIGKTVSDLENKALDSEALQEVISFILSSKQRRDFERTMELNMGIDLPDIGRFRVNIMRQRHEPAIVIRLVNSYIPSLEELRLPKILEEFAMEERGFVLLTGMTGSGKTTTLASMIDYRNQNTDGHIVTIEDPIEYYHEHKKCVVSQREVGVDTSSFAEALKNALRQRPDVILVGEIREREVMEQALVSAETGHLCLATIHASNAYQAIERIINLFPPEQVQQVRLNLSMNLKAIVSQRLVPASSGGLVPAVEVLINQALIRELIMKGETDKIHEIMEKNSTVGMCSYDQSLIKLYEAGTITEEVALSFADKTSDMKIKLQNANFNMKDVKKKSRESILKEIDTTKLSITEQ